jgi:hypothetical protein
MVPSNPSSEWPISQEDAATTEILIGNLTLLSAKLNVKVGNGTFAEKSAIHKDCQHKITFTIPDRFKGNFGLAESRHRQTELAKFAVKTWPLTFE